MNYQLPESDLGASESSMAEVVWAHVDVVEECESVDAVAEWVEDR